MDRTSPLTKVKKALSGKAGLAVSFVGVGAIALALGLHFGGGKAPAASVVAEGHGEGHTEGHNEAHNEGHAEEHATHAAKGGKAHHESPEEVAMHGGAKSEHHEASAPVDHRGLADRVLGTYASAWDSLQTKVDAVRTADLENERLRLENSHLRLALEGLQFNCTAKEASKKTNEIEYKLDRETGSTVGRDLASIAYRVPTNLVPGQLYTLGISYFKAREDEKAAVIFTFLTGLDDNDMFKTPKNFLLTGIAWYRLDNFAVADRYFDRALKAPESPENLQTLAHARLWKALTSLSTGKHTQSQFWLTELIDHHPMSDEASWVNSRHGGRSVSTRMPAEESTAQPTHSNEHHEGGHETSE